MGEQKEILDNQNQIANGKLNQYCTLRTVTGEGNAQNFIILVGSKIFVRVLFESVWREIKWRMTSA